MTAYIKSGTDLKKYGFEYDVRSRDWVWRNPFGLRRISVKPDGRLHVYYTNETLYYLYLLIKDDVMYFDTKTQEKQFKMSLTKKEREIIEKFRAKTGYF